MGLTWTEPSFFQNKGFGTIPNPSSLLNIAATIAASEGGEGSV